MKGMDFADQLFCRLMVVKDPAQVSALPQLQWPRTATLTACGPPTTLTSPPATSENTRKVWGDFIFYFYYIVEKQMVSHDELLQNGFTVPSVISKSCCEGLRLLLGLLVCLF